MALRCILNAAQRSAKLRGRPILRPVGGHYSIYLGLGAYGHGVFLHALQLLLRLLRQDKGSKLDVARLTIYRLSAVRPKPQNSLHSRRDDLLDPDNRRFA